MRKIRLSVLATVRVGKTASQQSAVQKSPVPQLTVVSSLPLLVSLPREDGKTKWTTSLSGSLL